MNKKELSSQKKLILILLFSACLFVLIGYQLSVNYNYSSILNNQTTAFKKMQNKFLAQQDVYNNVLTELNALPKFESYDIFKSKINDGSIVGRQKIYVDDKTMKKYDLYLLNDGTTKIGDYIIDPEKDFFIGEDVAKIKEKTGLVLKEGKIFHLKQE